MKEVFDSRRMKNNGSLDIYNVYAKNHFVVDISTKLMNILPAGMNFANVQTAIHANIKKDCTTSSSGRTAHEDAVRGL